MYMYTTFKNCTHVSRIKIQQENYGCFESLLKLSFIPNLYKLFIDFASSEFLEEIYYLKINHDMTFNLDL